MLGGAVTARSSLHPLLEIRELMVAGDTPSSIAHSLMVFVMPFAVIRRFFPL